MVLLSSDNYAVKASYHVTTSKVIMGVMCSPVNNNNFKKDLYMEKLLGSVSTLLFYFSGVEPTMLMLFVLALALIWLVAQFAPSKK